MLRLLLLISSLFLQGSYTSYTNPEKEYNLEINSSAHYKRQTFDGGYMDIFSILNPAQNAIDYTVTISKAHGTKPLTVEQLMSTTYKESYAGASGCEIEGEKQMHYKNFIGACFIIKMKTKNGYNKGYAINVPRGNDVYSIVLLTVEPNLERFNSEFDKVLNSLQFH